MAMSLEEFEAFFTTLPEGTDKRRLARALGLDLPVEVKPVAEQLAKVEVIKHTPKVKNKTPVEQTYITVPALQLGDAGSTRGFWLRADTARSVANRILEVCDKNNL